MKRGDQVSGALLLLGSLLALYQSTRLPIFEGHSLGSGFLPLCLSIGMAVFSVVVIMDGARRPQALDVPVSLPSGSSLRRILISVAALVAYVLLSTIVGYILATFGFVLLIVRTLGSYRWYQAVAFSALTSLGMYTVFHVLLKMVIPTGLFMVP